MAVVKEQSASTKKYRALSAYSEGVTDVAELAQILETSVTYVTAILKDAGLLNAYYDLSTTSTDRASEYGLLFQGTLSFKNVDAAKASVNRIDQIYRYFAFLGDRGGQHHSMLVALTGRNRALAVNKIKESEVFAEWLVAHLASDAAPTVSANVITAANTVEKVA